MPVKKFRVRSSEFRVESKKEQIEGRLPPRQPVRRPSLNSQLSTFPSGTVLVMVVALLTMFALMATTFLVTSRYDKIATAGAGISHQMETLLSMLDGDIRLKPPSPRRMPRGFRRVRT